MTYEDSLRNFFYYDMPVAAGKWAIPTADDFKKALDGLDAEEKCRFLLTPLSATTRKNALSYIITDGLIKNVFPEDKQCKIDFLTIALDEIEQLTQNRDKRLAILTGTNELGQTLLLKTLESGSAPLFDIVKERLRKWFGDDFANDCLKSFLGQSLGVINGSASFGLQGLGNSKEGPDRDRLLSLSVGQYQPAEYEGLKATIIKIRPLITEWLAANPEIYPQYSTKMKELVEDPDAVKHGPTPLAYAFPGEMFFRLLALQQKFDPKTPEQLADYIFEQVAKQDEYGHTSMHTKVAYDGHDYKDIMLGTLISRLGNRLGESVALDLIKRLLLLENKNGALPLDQLQDDDIARRDAKVGAFLKNLREDIGSREKFELYVKEIIAVLLPKGFGITFADYEPEPEIEINPATGKPKIQRGASWK